MTKGLIKLEKKHKRYLVEIEVREKMLREEREDLDDEFDIEKSIEKEFAWLCKSGIYLTKIEEFKRSK